ncbi:DUF2269 domain-containing protein [Streptomyces sp. DSM 42041]|uniref:DUF2269 domain-containing protein n=1 Tax=Streptomyces hazeniae TaxID=3075538 RepID=A0ABU2NSG2_9ACTN|nr:DUF2269 domain-containing protein [Streptomyces sp. DSM 42041]MDT0378932.1 DUF2269 domain-containing protein [Streptomyces sp. DSM 42041]
MASTPASPGARAALPRPLRRALLVVHVAASAAWLGLTLCLLTLALTAAATASPATDEVAYRAMDVFGDLLVAPLALLTFTTGLVLSLGTHWGLARYRWVWTKFWLTLVAGTASLLALRPALDRAAAAVTAGDRVDAYAVLFPPSVSLALYLFMTAVSVLKPWGRTRRGRRPGTQDHRRGEPYGSPQERKTRPERKRPGHPDAPSGTLGT